MARLILVLGDQAFLDVFTPGCSTPTLEEITIGRVGELMEETGPSDVFVWTGDVRDEFLDAELRRFSEAYNTLCLPPLSITTTTEHPVPGDRVVFIGTQEMQSAMEYAGRIRGIPAAGSSGLIAQLRCYLYTAQ